MGWGSSLDFTKGNRPLVVLGLPKETLPGEQRVALTPPNVARLVRGGFEVVVEAGAGAAADCSDADFIKGGARIASNAAEIWTADCNLTVWDADCFPATWVADAPGVEAQSDSPGVNWHSPDEEIGGVWSARSAEASWIATERSTSWQSVDCPLVWDADQCPTLWRTKNQATTWTATPQGTSWEVFEPNPREFDC